MAAAAGTVGGCKLLLGNGADITSIELGGILVRHRVAGQLILCN
jgi:hypothetical protein